MISFLLNFAAKILLRFAALILPYFYRRIFAAQKAAFQSTAVFPPVFL
jgi:hypothetical protein